MIRAAYAVLVVLFGTFFVMAFWSTGDTLGRASAIVLATLLLAWLMMHFVRVRTRAARG